MAKEIINEIKEQHKKYIYTKYVMKLYLYDFSKLILLMVFFLCYKKVDMFLYSYLLLFKLRTSAGGLHFKKYLSCLIFSTLYFYVNVLFLGNINVCIEASIIIYGLCCFIIFKIGPIHSSTKPILTQKQKDMFRKKSLSSAVYCSSLNIIIHETKYSNVGFWAVVLFTMQLTASFIIRKRGENNDYHTSSVSL